MITRFSLYGFLKNLRFYEPFIILLFREQGLSYLEIGLLYSIRDVATNVLEVPSGLLADTFGRKKAMLFSISAYIVSFVIFYFFSGFSPYAAAMLLFAIGEAFRTGTHKALILEYLHITGQENAKVRFYGQTRAASQFGSAINALLAAALVLYTGNYRYVFLATILPYLVNLINLSMYPKELDGKFAQKGSERTIPKLKSTLINFSKIFKESQAMVAILNSAGFTAFFKSTKDYLQPILQLSAVSLPLLLHIDDTRRAALLIGIVYFFIFMLTSYASKSSEKFSTKFRSTSRALNITFSSGAFMLLASGLALWLHLAPVAILGFMALYIIHNVRKPMNVARISDAVSNDISASALSTESQMTTILLAFLSPLLGLLADRLGIGPALAILAGLVLVVSFVFKIKDEGKNDAK